MRKALLLIAFLGMFVSCITDNFEPLSGADEPVAANPLAVPVDDALNELYDFMDQVYGPATRSGGRRAVSVETVTASALGVAATRSDSDLPPVEERAYLVNFGNDEGFALLGANVYMPGIICVTEKGSLTMDELLAAGESETQTRSGDDPPAWMSYEDAHNYGYGTDGNPDPFVYGDYCTDWDQGSTPEEDFGEHLISDTGESFITEQLYATLAGRVYFKYFDDPIPIDPSPSYSYTYSNWTIQADGRIGPLLTTAPGNNNPLRFSQGSPFDKYSPVVIGGKKGLVGCVVVALANIIAFHETPAPDDIYADATSTWAELKGYDYELKEGDDNYNASIENDMAHIMREIGKEVIIIYGPGFSFSIAAKAKKYLANKISGYSNVKKKLGYSESRIKETLSRQMPVWILAVTNSFSGHAWVIDGSTTQTRIKTTLVNGRASRTDTESRALYHCNFGWGGTANGYYLSNVFNPKEGPVLTADGSDLSTHPGAGHYSWHFRTLKYSVAQ